MEEEHLRLSYRPGAQTTMPLGKFVLEFCCLTPDVMKITVRKGCIEDLTLVEQEENRVVEPHNGEYFITWNSSYRLSTGNEVLVIEYHKEQSVCTPKPSGSASSSQSDNK